MKQPHTNRVLSVYTLLLLFYLVSHNTYGQERVYSPAELKEDFEVFKGSIEEMHPGLYWYATKEEMDEAFRQIESNLDNELTETAFFRMLSPVIAKIRCGHTWIAPSKETSKAHRENLKLFPLEIKLINEKVYCFRNDTDNKEIAAGNEILKINGFTTDSLVSLFYANNTGDGFVKTWKNFLFEKYFGHFYAVFIGRTNSFEIEFVDANGQTKHTTSNAVPAAIINERNKQLFLSRKNLELNFIEQEVALLNVRGFNPWKEGKKKKNFKKVLDQSFRSIDSAKVENLIIDLRGNTGGYEKYGLWLLSYFKEEAFTGYKYIRFKENSFKYRKYSKTSLFPYLMFKAILNIDKVNDTTYLLKNDRNIKPVKPLTPTYKGNVYVLIGGGSFSTTSDFVSLFQYHQLGTLVGEETGGGVLGNSGNYSFELTLPNTKIRYELPITQYMLNIEQTKGRHGSGVIPDFPVQRDISDLIGGVDTQLNFVLDLINNN